MNAAAKSISSATSSPTKGLWLDGLLFAAIVVAAMTLRVIYVHQLSHFPFFSHLQMDPWVHDQWARAILEGHRFWDGAYFRAPGYPAFLAAIYWLVGADGIAPRIAQSAVGALNCGLLFVVGRVVFGRLVGAIAGFAAATYWMLIYFDAELVMPVLSIFLNLLLFLALYYAARRDQLWLWIVSGLLLGLSAIVRPDVLPYAPALVAWQLALYWRRWTRFVFAAGLLFVGTMTPIVPITIHNVLVGHDFSLIATQGGVNFYIGNNPGSDGMSAVIPGDPAEWQACFNAQIARAERAMGRKLKGSEVSDYYYREAYRFMREQPAVATRLMLAKLAYFWSNWEISNNQDIHFVTTEYTHIVQSLPLSFAIVGPLGMLGLLLCLRRPLELFPLWGYVPIQMLTVIAFFVAARFRTPVVIVLILLGSYAAVWLVQQVFARRWKSLGLAALVLAPMGLLAARTPPGVDLYSYQGNRTVGMYLADQGDYPQAEKYLDRAIEAAKIGFTVDPLTWYYIGYTKYQLNQVTEAKRCFESALQIDPRNARAAMNLGVLLQNEGRAEEALRYFQIAVESEPENGVNRGNYALALIQRGQYADAAPHISAAVRLDAAVVDAFVSAAANLARARANADAMAILDAAMEGAPDDLRLLLPAAQLRASPDGRVRDVGKARDLVDRIFRVAPDDPQALLGGAMACAGIGQSDRAVETLTRALELAKRQNKTALAEQIEQRLKQLRR